MKKFLIPVITFASMAIQSCGITMSGPSDHGSSLPNDKHPSPFGKMTSHDDEGPIDMKNPFEKPSTKVAGYVVSAFQVTVDGQSYPDLENYYTQEIKRLPARAKAAGYDESYDVKLDAQIGFRDLWNRMFVYILASGKNGYQATTFVDGDGGFSTTLPKSEEKNEYRIRAVKRINIIITKGSERKVLCYNFSAKEQAVHFSEKAGPVILNDFVTDITAYKCDGDLSSGLIIPDFVEPQVITGF